MERIQISCKNCGLPLPEPEAGQKSITCPYCGTRQKVKHPGSAYYERNAAEIRRQAEREQADISSARARLLRALPGEEMDLSHSYEENCYLKSMNFLGILGAVILCALAYHSIREKYWISLLMTLPGILLFGLCLFIETESIHWIRNRVVILILAAMVLVGCIQCLAWEGSGSGPIIDWYDIRLNTTIPRPSSLRGKVLQNQGGRLRMHLRGMSDADVAEYKEDCRDSGFSSFNMSLEKREVFFNEKGWKLEVTHETGSHGMDLDLRAPLQMEPFTWSFSALPDPGCQLAYQEPGKDQGMHIYVSPMEYSDWEAYVSLLQNQGWKAIEDRKQMTFLAENGKGQQLFTGYLGNQMAEIHLKEAPMP